MVCLTSCVSQGLPVYTVGARGWHPDRGLSLLPSGRVCGASTQSQAWSCLPSLCTSSGRAQAARQRVQCVAGEANRMDDDDQSVDMEKLVFRPNPERLGLELSHSRTTTSD